VKTNYQFERRQRDLAKKKKQEEKRLRKLAGKAQPGEGDPGTDQPEPQGPDTATPAAGDK
jgi:hypothetical protein